MWSEERWEEANTRDWLIPNSLWNNTPPSTRPQPPPPPSRQRHHHHHQEWASPRQSLPKEVSQWILTKQWHYHRERGYSPFVFGPMWLVAFQRVSLSQGLDPGFRASKSIPDMHPPRDCQKELESLWVGKWHLSWWQALILLNAMSMWPHTSESHIQQRKGIIPPRKTQLTAPYESEEVRPIWIPFVESLYENYEIWLGRLAEIKIQTNKNIFKTNSEGKNNSTKGLTLPLRSLLAMSSFLKLHSLESQHWVG